MKDDFKIKMPRIRFPEGVWKRLWAYIEACPDEVGGLGLIEARENALVVSEIFLLEQEVTAGTTDLDPSAVARLQCGLMERETDPGALRFWWHSHADSPCYWSPVDQRTIGKLSSADYCLSLVGNRKREHRLRLDVSQPVPFAFDDLDHEVIEEIDPALAEAARLEVEAKVRQPRSFWRKVLT